MVGVFVNICPLPTTEICLKTHIICQSRFKILPNTKAFKIVWDFNLFAKFRQIWLIESRINLITSNDSFLCGQM